MGVVSVFKTVLQFWRNLISSIQACYRWIRNNFIILVVLIISLLVCWFFPSLLTFLLSCAPILVCTAVLLNTLLSSGSSDEPQQGEKRDNNVYITSTNSREVGKHKERERERDSSAETRLRKRNDFRQRALERSGLAYGSRASSSREKKVAFVTTQHDDFIKSKTAIGEEEQQSNEVTKKENDDSDEGETSNFDSDQAECSSPDTPPLNVLPVIDEIDPLLDNKPPQVNLTANDEFDATVDASDRSVDESVDSEVENQEEKQKNEEDGAALVTWTEDDEKNLMDLGTSELERNQRLENLIAKRRARKVAEKNLIDFDSNDPPVQIPTLATVKTNPFDIPYNSNEINGLPTVPGSAPSVLVPRGNPFDIPYDPQEEKPNLTNDSFQQEFLSVFCRHESFSYGPSYVGSNKLDRYNTKFTPYFDGSSSSEGNQNQNQNRFTSILGQGNDRRNSPSWSLQDSEWLPPIDRKNRKKQMDRVLSLGVYPSGYSSHERGVPEVKFMRTVQEVKREPVVKEVEKIEAFTEPEVVKESTEEDSHSHSKEPPPSKPEPEPEPPLEDEQGVDDTHIKEPVYDSSPSAVEKRTIDEYLVYSDKSPVLTSASSIASDMQFEGVGLRTSCSIASDMQVEVSEAGSPRESFDRYPYTDGESSFHDEIDKNTIESRDSEVEEKEVRPVEETESSNETPMERDIDAEEGSLNSTEEANNIDNVNDINPETIKEDVEESNGVHDSTEVASNPSTPVEATTADDEESKAVPSEITEVLINSSQPVEDTTVDDEESKEVPSEIIEVLINSSQPVEATTVDDEESKAVPSEITEVLINSSEPVEATMVDDDESNVVVVETTDVLINSSEPVEATVDVEASIDEKTLYNNMDQETLEASHVEDKDVKEIREGKMDHTEDEKLQKENQTESEKTEMPIQDQSLSS